MRLRYLLETRLTIKQETEYPKNGKIRIKTETKVPEKFVLNLRIPSWSKENKLSINGEEVKNIQSGSYLTLDRQWKNDDIIELNLDMSPHYWVGEKELDGKTSIYHGPIVLTYDRYFNKIDPNDIPMLDARDLSIEMVAWSGWIQPLLLAKVKAKDGQDVYLCDFASAGVSGTPYRSWLEVEGVSAMPFSKENPKRICRV